MKKKILIKAASVTLTVSMMLSIASCRKEEHTSKKATVISEDTPWFESTAIDVISGADPEKDIEYSYQYFAGSDDKYIVVRTSGRYRQPPENEIDWDTFNFNDYNFSVIAVIDRNTKSVVNTIDLTSGTDKDMLSYEHVDSAYYSDGIITVKTNSKERDYNPLTGELLDTRALASNNTGAYTTYYNVGDYTVEVEMNWDDNDRSSAVITCKSPDGKAEPVELNEPGTDIYVHAVLAISDTTAVVPVMTDKGGRFYELDITTNKLEQVSSKNYEWLDINELGEAFTGSDGQVYIKTSTGINKINARTKSIEEIFNYSWCGINQSTITMLDMAECSEDSIVLIGQIKPSSVYEPEPREFQIVELTRADKNPHAGKTVLELFAVYFDENIGEAVIRFNESSKDYYIEVIERYDESDYDSGYVQLNNDDEIDQNSLNIASGISNALAVDIMNGEGPDILINTSKYSQLNNPAYLVDLTPYVKNLDSENYFTNIIDGSKIDGALYQLPVSFTINGIYTDAKEAGASGVGFTLEEYQKFVNESLNGTDIILSGQPYYFVSLFNNMNEKFISDGKVDFSGPEFAELAEYVKDNVPEQASSWNSLSDRIYNYVDNWPVYGIGGFYFRKTGMIKNPTILGMPSLDGRGPMFSSLCSVAISAQAPDIDACGEFVKILLSDEIQTSIAMNDYFVLNRSAFRAAGLSANEYYNNGGRECSSGSGVFSDASNPYSEKDIDNVERVIMSCSKMVIEDSDISIILIEEMPAYFLGQKDLSKVIRIAENRAQKVLDERGT